MVKASVAVLVNKKNYETYYSEKNNFLVTKDDMIKAGNNITPSLKINYSGQILKVSPFACKLHRGIPFFLTKETVLYKTKNDLVKVGDTIGTIIFEQAVTGDIVQGLPKVEEILEVPKVVHNLTKMMNFRKNSLKHSSKFSNEMQSLTYHKRNMTEQHLQSVLNEVYIPKLKVKFNAPYVYNGENDYNYRHM